MTSFNNDATQAEKLAALHNSTLHGRTRVDDDRGGRYSALSKPTVIGSVGVPPT